MHSKKSKFKFKLAAIATSLVMFAGCAEVATVAGYDTKSLNEDSAKSYAELISKSRASGTVDNNSAIARRVKTIFNRMLPYADAANKTGEKFNWQLNVIRSNEVNAFAMPGGKMVVFTGIVNKLNLTDDEIAAIVGHEMTHALEEHSKKAAGQQIITNTALKAGGSILQSKTGLSASTVELYKDTLSKYGLTLPFSRHQENKADIGGLRLMAQAGYNPEAAVSVWQKMNKTFGSNSSTSLLSTHPSNDARIASIQKMLPAVMPIYKQSKFTSGKASNGSSGKKSGSKKRR
jgi:Zn-dependent protease with chaperone function